MDLTLTPNPLYAHQQTLQIGKLATLIGENGSGKSSILQSIFEAKLDQRGFDELRVVCFSSGQNENFSQRFARYLKSQRRRGRQLSLECFYFDKSWSKLLIFLATCLHSSGQVRGFLREYGYVDEGGPSTANPDDVSTKLKAKFKIDIRYFRQAQAALQQEEREGFTSFRSSPFFRSLSSFIEHNVDRDYDFETTLQKRLITLTAGSVLAASYDDVRPEDEEAATHISHPMLGFFTQLSSSNRFLDKNTIQLYLKDGLELDQLSDGEYQLLFLFALIDLFDEESTLFLLDEADSHLHYQNISRLWRILGALDGRAITTTHLLDSITANNFEDIKVVEQGCIRDDDKLKQLIARLSILSRATSVEYEVCAKISHMALLDDYNDWEIFLRLAKRKGLDTSRLDSVYAFKKSSGYENDNHSFGGAKIQWAENLSKVECALVTTQVFLICDRDEATLDIDIESGVKVQGRQYRDSIRAIRWPRGLNVSVHLLAWTRREIKNYLLSHTALSHHGKLAEINSAELAQAHHLVPNDPGDKEGIRRLAVKDTINPLINGPDGLCQQKLQDYIDLIPPEEISADIENMYNFIVGKLN